MSLDPKKTRHFKHNDLAVVFHFQDSKGKSKRPIACHIPKSELGHTGTIYQKQDALWNRLLNRRHLKSTNVPTKKEMEDRDLVLRPYHLKIVDGRDKELLLTSLSPQNIEQAKSFMRGEVQFEYKFIDPSGMEDHLIAETVWSVEPEAGMEVPDMDEIREIQERREVIYDMLIKTQRIIGPGGAWYEDNDKWNDFDTLWGSFFGGAEPTPVAGSTTLQAVVAFVSGIFKENDAWGAEDINSWSGGMQSVHEGLGIGVNIVAHCRAIHKLRTSDPESPQLKKHTADLILAFGKGLPVSVSSIDTIGQGILASGQSGADLAQQFADQMAPFAAFASFLGSVISAASAARSFRRAKKSFARRNEFDSVMALSQQSGLQRDFPFPLQVQATRTISAVPRALERFMSATRM